MTRHGIFGILARSAGFVVAGALTGSASAALAWMLSAVGHPPVPADAVGWVTLGAWWGALLGAVTGPVLGWTLLRHVPLGRAMAACGSGAVTGGVLAMAMSGDPVLWPACALAGAAAVGTGLAITAHRSRPGPGQPDAHAPAA